MIIIISIGSRRKRKLSRIPPSLCQPVKEVYGRAKEADKFLMSQQPALKHSWNTMVASSFWGMRLSILAMESEPDGESEQDEPNA